jgi:hypothetical protein
MVQLWDTAVQIQGHGADLQVERMKTDNDDCKGRVHAQTEPYERRLRIACIYLRPLRILGDSRQPPEKRGGLVVLHVGTMHTIFGKNGRDSCIYLPADQGAVQKCAFS